jgi:hypothetical protein
MPDFYQWPIEDQLSPFIFGALLASLCFSESICSGIRMNINLLRIEIEECRVERKEMLKLEPNARRLIC